jgi:hypothetical protein
MEFITLIVGDLETWNNHVWFVTDEMRLACYQGFQRLTVSCVELGTIVAVPETSLEINLQA